MIGYILIKILYRIKEEGWKGMMQIPMMNIKGEKNGYETFLLVPMIRYTFSSDPYSFGLVSFSIMSIGTFRERKTLERDAIFWFIMFRLWKEMRVRTTNINFAGLCAGRNKVFQTISACSPNKL